MKAEWATNLIKKIASFALHLLEAFLCIQRKQFVLILIFLKLPRSGKDETLVLSVWFCFKLVQNVSQNFKNIRNILNQFKLISNKMKQFEIFELF
jgi:hypothetical protein